MSQDDEAIDGEIIEMVDPDADPVVDDDDDNDDITGFESDEAPIVEAEIVDADVVEPGPPPTDAPTHEIAVSFPRLSARTQRFTLGEPRNVSVSGDGRRIVFARSRGGADPVNCLWVVDAATGDERLVADPARLLGDDADELPPDERARRERAREAAGGITSYALDADASLAAFALAGRLFVSDLDTGDARELPVPGPVFDPRPDPSAQRVAYVRDRTLCVAGMDGSWHVAAGGDETSDDAMWGRAEFIAAEEMGRFRGHWWSPDGAKLAVARVDNAAVERMYIGDPATPTEPATEVRYPAAGTPNSDVTLHVVDLRAGRLVEVSWDRRQLPYLTDVCWSDAGLLVSTQSRDQRTVEVFTVNPLTGATVSAFSDTDTAWVSLVPGSPRLTGRGQLVTCGDRDGACRLLVDGFAITPTDLQVRGIVAVGDDDIVFTANPVDDATVAHVWRYSFGDETLVALTDEPGLHTASAGGGTVVIRTATLGEPRTSWDTLDGVELTSHAAIPGGPLHAVVAFLGRRRLASVLVLPCDHDGRTLPVLVDPYGGPHALRAVRAHHAHLTSQWFADQGFAVLVTDGRGTPGRGSDWERAVHRDLATAVLEDQVDALEQAAADYGCLDLDRVGIRGWSFGGYLAALAVLLRPDRFHAGIAGAPVTEWRLYDTHYTERYLGDPATAGADYDGSSLLPLARDLTRPLLMIHGLADDNVVAAHTLRLSSALLAAGRPHEVLPLVGVTHMTPQEVVAENLMLHQLDFLRRSLPPAAGDYGAR